jgi:hypothetical protein
MAYQFYAGQAISMRVSAIGIASYEDFTVESVDDEVVTLEGSERSFTLDGWEIDPIDSFGFTFSIAPKQ